MKQNVLWSGMAKEVPSAGRRGVIGDDMRTLREKVLVAGFKNIRLSVFVGFQKAAFSAAVATARASLRCFEGIRPCQA